MGGEALSSEHTTHTMEEVLGRGFDSTVPRETTSIFNILGEPIRTAGFGFLRLQVL